MRRLALLVLSGALLLPATAVLAHDPNDPTTWEPVPCEWYPPGWPLEPDWAAQDWIMLAGTPDECAAAGVATPLPAPTGEIGEPLVGVNPRMTLPPTDTGG